MDSNFGTALAPIAPKKKAAARVALVDLKDATHGVLSECFKQFGVEPIVLPGNAAERLKKEKFEACVVRLGPGAQAVMEAVRTSPSNSRMVIYGLGGSAQEAMRYSKYGINAIFQEPVERSTALKLVRATNMLVLHEFRRYVRIPVMTEVSLQLNEGKKLTATTGEEHRRHSLGTEPRNLICSSDPAAHLDSWHGDLETTQAFFRRSLRCRR
jgi:hypothetical protein